MFLVAKDDLGRAGKEGNFAQHLIAARQCSRIISRSFGELAGLAQNFVGIAILPMS